jgi:hypothetical protein
MYVDSLWRKSFLLAGGAPSCELGCVGGRVHLGRECGRPIGSFDVALKATDADSEATIRVGLAGGPDFIKVTSAHRTDAVFLELPVRESHPLGAASASFSIGICILPTCVPGSTLAATYRTAAFIDGTRVRFGKLPHVFTIVKERARVVESVRFCGAPLGPFLGISAATWKRIWGSSCAMQRYGHVIYGHTSKRAVPKLDACEMRQPGCSVDPKLAPPPQPILWQRDSEKVRCGYCGKSYDTWPSFITGCAPDFPG